MDLVPADEDRAEASGDLKNSSEKEKKTKNHKNNKITTKICNDSLCMLPTCDGSMLVSADLQFRLLLSPQLQKDAGRRVTCVVPPAEYVGQSIGVFAQLQDRGEDDAVNVPRTRLYEIRIRTKKKIKSTSSSAFFLLHAWKQK